MGDTRWVEAVAAGNAVELVGSSFHRKKRVARSRTAAEYNPIHFAIPRG